MQETEVEIVKCTVGEFQEDLKNVVSWQLTNLFHASAIQSMKNVSKSHECCIVF